MKAAAPGSRASKAHVAALSLSACTCPGFALLSRNVRLEAAEGEGIKASAALAEWHANNTFSSSARRLRGTDEDGGKTLERWSHRLCWGTSRQEAWDHWHNNTIVTGVTRRVPDLKPGPEQTCSIKLVFTVTHSFLRLVCHKTHVCILLPGTRTMFSRQHVWPPVFPTSRFLALEPLSLMLLSCRRWFPH